MMSDDRGRQRADQDGSFHANVDYPGSFDQQLPHRRKQQGNGHDYGGLQQIGNERAFHSKRHSIRGRARPEVDAWQLDCPSVQNLRNPPLFGNTKDRKVHWTRGKLACAAIHARPSKEEPEGFAVEELALYLRRMLGQALPLGAPVDAPYPCILIRATPAENDLPKPPPQGYVIRVDRDTIVLSARNGSGLLHATYALLKQLGCGWSLDGREHDRVPSLSGPLSLRNEQSARRFPVFGFCSDLVSWHYTQPELFHQRLQEDRELIDWMAKTGANAFFFIRHPFDSVHTISELELEFRQRGVELEHGGHVLPVLLPRELFSTHPEFFPVNPEGERTDLGNLCPSHPRALHLVAENALMLLRSLPPTRAFHLWGADLWKGGWCHCPLCQALTPQDQSLRTCNAVAQVLARSGIDVPVCYLAYHDTLDAQLHEKPFERVWCEFAPRERCYAHGIADPNCDRNRRYWRALQQYLDHFSGRVRVFEYYGDAILFFGCAVPLTATIQQDLDHYRAAGIEEILMLEFGAYSRWAYALNFLAFTYGAAGRAVSPEVNAYCQTLADGGDSLTQELAEMERLVSQLACYGDLRLPPRDPALAESVARNLARAVPQLGALADRLEGHRGPAARALGTLVRYTQAVFAGVEHELQTRTSAEKIFSSALEILAGVDRRWKGVWGEIDLPTIHSIYLAAPFVSSAV